MANEINPDEGLMDDNVFWSTIDEWTDPTTKSAEYCGNTSLHKQIYEECKNFDGWYDTLEPNSFDEKLVYNLTTLSGSDMSRWEYLKEYQFSTKGPIYGKDVEYWWSAPQKKDFPTIYEFMEENPQYIDPVLSKISANNVLLAHHHGPVPQYLYNMSINEPEGSKLAIHPLGIIPYKPGDIYKLYVHYNHAVINGNETRYHLMFKGGRIEQAA